METPMEVTEEVLAAYADGELDDARRPEVEQALAANPQLAARLQHYRALQERLRGTYDDVLNEPLPARLIETLRAGTAVGDASSSRAGRKAEVADLAAHRAAAAQSRATVGQRSPVWLAAAASVLLGLALGYSLPHRDGAPMLQVHDGNLIAQGTLAAALDTQLAAQQSRTETVQVGLSFRNAQGRYCRTFATGGATALAGLACHARDAWQLSLLTGDDRQSAGAYRTAASGIPPAVLARVQAEISGEPLDAAQEAAAAKAHWR
jgi:hypothetical protein